MIFNTTVTLKNGKLCILRSAEAADAAFARYSRRVLTETDYLMAGAD